MAQIRYNPTTGGSTFGDPSKYLEGASRSLNAATSGIASSFDKFRTGEIDAKKVRTDEALTAIQGVNTEEGKADLMARMKQAGGAQNLFQGVDQNKVNTALNKIDDNIYAQTGKLREREASERSHSIQQAGIHDKPILDDFQLGLRGQSLEELQEIDPSSLESLGVSDPNKAADMLLQVIAQKQGTADATFNREQSRLIASDNALTRANKEKTTKQSAILDDLLNEQINSGSPLDVDRFLLDADNQGIDRSTALARVARENEESGQNAKTIETKRLALAKEDADKFTRQLKEKADSKADSPESLENSLAFFSSKDDLLGIGDSSRVIASRKMAEAIRNGADVSDVILVAMDSRSEAEEMDTTKFDKLIKKYLPKETGSGESSTIPPTSAVNPTMTAEEAGSFFIQQARKASAAEINQRKTFVNQ